MIYEPREDSFLLSKIVKEYSKDRKVLDVGCGSGVQMGAALEGGASEVLGADIDENSLEVCRNKGLNVLESDLFSNVRGKFDLIVFNPPYLPEDEREDLESSKATSGGKKGDEIVIRFLNGVGRYLEEGGKILLVVSSLTPLNEIENVIGSEGMKKRVLGSEKLFMERIEVWEIWRV